MYLTNEKTMSVREIAEVLGVSDQTIRNWVKEYYPDIIRNGIETRLNETQITVIKRNMDKNYSLKNAFEVKTNLEKALLIKQAMQLQDEIITDLTKENEALKNKFIEQKPKVEAFEKYIEINGIHSIGDVAKLLNIGRNKLFKFLRENKILMRSNVPYQQYLDQKLFEVKISTIENIDENKPTTYATPKGIEFIRKLLSEVK